MTSPEAGAVQSVVVLGARQRHENAQDIRPTNAIYREVESLLPLVV